MPNFTPAAYRKFYEIYPPPEGAREGAAATLAALATILARLGRHLGAGPGGALPPRGASGQAS
jgi:hypothetical protein